MCRQKNTKVYATKITAKASLAQKFKVPNKVDSKVQGLKSWQNKSKFQK